MKRVNLTDVEANILNEVPLFIEEIPAIGAPFIYGGTNYIVQTVADYTFKEGDGRVVNSTLLILKEV